MRKSRTSGSARGRPSNGLVYSPCEQFVNDFHQLSFDDTAVIPLWQIRDYFGVNPRLQGTIEAEDVYPTSLYERIEEWINNEEQPANK